VADATFYTLADARFFVGTVALLNSLRLTGHTGELVVLDCGLAEEQRRTLAPHVTLEQLPDELARRTVLCKPFIHTLGRPGPLVWIDSDIIVTGPLAPILAHAEAGKLCFYPVDWPAERRRRFPEWVEAFDLASPPRRQTYVSAGFFALVPERWPGLLERWWQACAAIPLDRLFGPDVSDPFWAGDQDALNALLMSEIPPDAIEELPAHEAVFPPAMHRVRIVSRQRLDAVHDGHRIRLLHYTWVPKPWTTQAWGRIPDMRRDAYVRLLPRVLFADDVALRLPTALVPLWLRPGGRGRLALEGVAMGKRMRSRAAAVVRRLPAPLRKPLIALRDRIEPPERGRRDSS
jgi:hypothetical protein